MGFYAQACGLTDEDISEQPSFDQIQFVANDKVGDFFFAVSESGSINHTLNSNWACDLMSVNDDEGLTEAEREKNLTEWFADKGITIHFKD